MRSLVTVIAMASAGHLAAQGGVTVEVVLSKPDAGGYLMLAVCPSADSFANDKGCRTMRVPVKGAVERVVFADLPHGPHAVKVFHDVNANGTLDTNWMGIPREPYGFGNDAMGTMGPPTFQQASVRVGPGEQVARVRMKG
jgi:uncharacterized protein (DUF2141 family)